MHLDLIVFRLSALRSHVLEELLPSFPCLFDYVVFSVLHFLTLKVFLLLLCIGGSFEKLGPENPVLQSQAGILPAFQFSGTFVILRDTFIRMTQLPVRLVFGMSDDEVDSDLLELVRKSLGIDANSAARPAKTRVLEDAEYIYDNATDVALDMRGTKIAASSIWTQIQEKQYSTRDWSKHELHPKAKDESTVDFIFLMDLFNFCFWSDSGSPEQYAVEYRGKTWTGYWSLVAAIQRALDEGTIWIVYSLWWRLTGGGLQGYR